MPLSPTAHEAAIKRHMTDGDDPALQSLHDAVKTTRELATKAAATTDIVLKNAMKTEASRHKDARAAGFSLIERATRSVDEAVRAAQHEIITIQAKVKAPLAAKDIVSETRQRELRERLSMLPEDRRKAIIAEAIKSDDEVLISAILSAPAWLSGITDAELALHRNNWASKHFAADLDRMSRLSKAVEDANRAGSVAVSFVDCLTDAKLVENAEAMERQAHAALAAVK